MPSSALEIHEKAWNAYPYSKTEYSVRAPSLSLASDRDTTHVRSACNLTLVLSHHCLVARFVRASSVPLLANDFR